MRELDSFFHDISYRLKIANDTKKLLDKRLASSFSLFPYIAPNENRISEIIRDLLDPNGNHGQGDIFLQKFLEVIGKSDIYEIGDQANIRTEERTTSIENDKRRIDILIEIKRNNQHHAGIAIENKPWAIDQNQQIDDYIDHIKQRYPNYYIIYLTPDGREPPEHSAAKTKTNDKDALIPISYEHHITSWLQACHKESQADYVRQFLLDFSSYCRQPNLNHQNMKNTEIEYQTVIEYILDQENEDKFKIGLLICNQWITEKIKKNIITNFSKKLSEKVTEKFPDYEIKSDLESYPSEWCSLQGTRHNYPIHIILQNHNKFANGFYIGILLKKEYKIIQQLRDDIFNELAKFHSFSCRKDKAWIYVTDLENHRNWTDDFSTLFKLHRYPEVIEDYIIGQFEYLLNVVEKHSNELTLCQPAG